MRADYPGLSYSPKPYLFAANESGAAISLEQMGEDVSIPNPPALDPPCSNLHAQFNMEVEDVELEARTALEPMRRDPSGPLVIEVTDRK